MLSRNAERIYWLGRYIERAEDTARLLNVFSHLMLDLPQSHQLDWSVLLKIMSVEADFNKRYDTVSEENVVRFLLTDLENPGSIRSAVRAARENARTLRDMIPLEGWEMLNELNLFMKRSPEDVYRRRHRFQCLTDIIARCQCFNGMIQSTLSRTDAYEFLSMGEFIERADMITRTLDVATGILLHRSEEASAFDSHIWMEVLKAQNAVMMYRTVNGPRISPEAVLQFLLCRNDFPRSSKYCLTAMRQLAETLPRNQGFLSSIDNLTASLEPYGNPQELVPATLHELFDEMQIGLNELHNIITNTWFLSAAAVAAETQSQTQTQTQDETS
uniref:Protein containing domains DUF403 n=1 Tax=uncultured Thiotrichaceae bacterium TaxID=298394 RepID=A0A6S6U9X5_9GAMM|nr:MAG: Protein containing domains DUF403 [uncultured Thiotrichaceae bacterium]